MNIITTTNQTRRYQDRIIAEFNAQPKSLSCDMPNCNLNALTVVLIGDDRVPVCDKCNNEILYRMS